MLVKTVEAFKRKTLLLAPWPFRRGRFPLSRWRRPSIRSLRRLSAIASHMSSVAASLNKSDGRKAAQEKGEVTQTDEVAHEATSGVGEDAC
jgi:hypothetical protein